MDVEKLLLDNETYEDYLDSFVLPQDLFYLRNHDVARQLVTLGYRSAIDILTEKQFYEKREGLLEGLFANRRPHLLFSSDCRTKNVLLMELASRERSNRLGMITTIISLRVHQPNGIEISGFIDYEDSLRKSITDYEEGVTDWLEIFKETQTLTPSVTDLGYYNWHTGYSITNDSSNFKAITDPIRGLIFESKRDRRQLFVDPAGEVGSGSMRTVIKSDLYKHAVLFDHVIRNKI